MRIRGLGAAGVAVTLFLLTACARPTPGPGGPASPGSSGDSPPPADALMLRIERFGGFAAPDQMLGRLPDVSVYGDGRLITQGPQVMIYPGPALPNVQVQRLDPATVRALAGKAGDAGVRPGVDLGQPGVADAPTTRITVASSGGIRTLDVVALTEARPDDPRLTPEQRAARAKLAAFVQEVSDLSAASGVSESQPYRPTAVAALALPYVRASDGLPNPPAPVAWPGPALPGELLGARTGCVTVSGSAAGDVLAAATTATAITPWTSAGKRWTVVFRPLLPDESGCADLRFTR